MLSFLMWLWSKSQDIDVPRLDASWWPGGPTSDGSMSSVRARWRIGRPEPSAAIIPSPPGGRPYKSLWPRARIGTTFSDRILWAASPKRGSSSVRRRSLCTFMRSRWLITGKRVSCESQGSASMCECSISGAGSNAAGAKWRGPSKLESSTSGSWPTAAGMYDGEEERTARVKVPGSLRHRSKSAAVFSKTSSSRSLRRSAFSRRCKRRLLSRRGPGQFTRPPRPRTVSCSTIVRSVANLASLGPAAMTILRAWGILLLIDVS
mmetsp:Transcript_79834/g.222292  ORF Transcript_79834/g.222292 Transcript_79834/m.222292 type:complete len:263 (-) Transcript_79834:954-1742(-)